MLLLLMCAGFRAMCSRANAKLHRIYVLTGHTSV